MTAKLILFYIIVACLISSGITAGGLYLCQILPLESKLNEKNDEADDALIRKCQFDVVIAVSLREAGQEKTLQLYDDKILPSTIQILSQLSKEQNRVGSGDCPYLLWRIKKYSRDFSVTFPEKEMEILKEIPDERPRFSGKIGND
jgi:hypothetical protein